MFEISRRAFLGTTTASGLVLPISRPQAAASAVRQNRYQRIQRMFALPRERLKDFKIQMHAAISDRIFESRQHIYDLPVAIFDYTPIVEIIQPQPHLLYLKTQDYEVPSGEQLVRSFDLFDDEGYLVASEPLLAAQHLFWCDRLRFTFNIESSFLTVNPTKWGRVIRVNDDVIRRDDPPYSTEQLT